MMAVYIALGKRGGEELNEVNGLKKLNEHKHERFDSRAEESAATSKRDDGRQLFCFKLPPVLFLETGTR